MRCNPWRWLWGLIPILMLSWIAFHLQRPAIESDLSRRTQQVLEEAGLDWATVSFSGRDAIVSGRAPDEATPRKALQAVRSVWGVRVVRARTDLIPRVRDYSWTASVRNTRLVTSGYVPNTEDRRSVLRILKSTLPDFRIQDDMQLARGEPDSGQWLERIAFAAKQLRYLKRGRVQLTGRTLRVTGEAKDFTNYKTLASELQSGLPAGLTTARNEVTPPVVDPFSWEATLSEKQMMLGGHVPREDLREQLFGRAKVSFPNLSIVDRMKTARGAPRNWERVVFLALEQLALMRIGTAELVGRDLTFTGETVSEVKAEQIAGDLRRGLPETYKLIDNISFPKPVYPVASPFVTTIEWIDGGIELTGYAPSPQARRWLIDQIRDRFSRTIQIRDRLSLGSGQADGWQPCLAAGIESFAKFRNGRVQLVGRRLELKSETRDPALHRSVPTELRAAANRACDTTALISLTRPDEPDLTWRGIRSENEVVLEGEVPSARAKAELVDTANRFYPSLRIVDRTKIVARPEGNWVTVAQLGLKLLAGLRSGEAVLHEQTLLIRGQAEDTAAKTSIKMQLDRDLSENYSGRERVTVRSSAMLWAEQEAQRRKQEAQRLAEQEAQRLAQAEADRRRAEDEARRQQAAAEEAARRRREAEEALRKRKQEEEARRRQEAESRAKKCETDLMQTAGEGVIRFDFGRATIKPQSTPTLMQLAKLVRNCPAGTVEISGHTDSDGGDDANMKLSQRRAEAVMEFLANADVPADRMRAIGYGETRPVAPNTTASNKAKNRRIEFKVVVE